MIIVENNNNKGTGIIIAIVIIALLALFGSCSNSDDDYRNTLESGQRKYYSGEKMTKEEYNAVKGFNKWKSNQGSKTYSDWDN